MALTLPAQPDRPYAVADAAAQRAIYFPDGGGSYVRGLYRAAANAGLGDEGYEEVDVYCGDRPAVAPRAMGGSAGQARAMGAQHGRRSGEVTLKRVGGVGEDVSAAVHGVLDSAVVALRKGDELVVPGSAFGFVDAKVTVKVVEILMAMDGVWHCEVILP